MKKYAFVAIIILLVVIGCIFWPNRTAAPAKPAATQPSKSSSSSTAKFNKSLLSTTDPASIWIVVNKQHPLVPQNYAPTDLVVPNVPLRVPGNESMQLRKAPAAALELMFSVARQQGIDMMLSSGYRSYSYQVSLYNGYVATQGQATADTQSARPGYSEHQTGLAVDVEPADQSCDVDPCFGDTSAGKWVAANAYKYGFIVRYTKGNEAITGYEPEAWHLRYVGTALSSELHDTGVTTLEQFFGISGGQKYN